LVLSLLFKSRPLLVDELASWGMVPRLLNLGYLATAAARTTSPFQDVGASSAIEAQLACLRILIQVCDVFFPIKQTNI
jgi:hypothetical protein